MMTVFEGWEWVTNAENFIERCRKRVYIYGTMQKSRLLQQILMNRGIEISGYIVSDGYKHADSYNETCVFELSDVKDIEEATVIICGGESLHVMESNIRKKGKTDYEVFDACTKRAIIPEEIRKSVNAANNGVLFRLRITNRCPSKCRFCGQRVWSQEKRNLEADPKWYFDYMKPLYPKMKAILITGGDAFYAKRSYEYLEFLQKEYGHINVMAETDGLSFKREFQEIAVNNIMRLHISLNASNAKTYEKGVWDGEGGEKAFSIKVENIRNYIRMLHDEEKDCFAPSFSMVINKDTVTDIVSFAELSLEYGAGSIGYFFDYEENNMDGSFFSDPEIMRPALKTLMEMERVLDGRVNLTFRLWIPLKEISIAEAELRDISDSFLLNKYKQLDDLAKGRDIKNEYEKREYYRDKYGKRSLNSKEDICMTLHDGDVLGRRVCGLPWDFMDLYPDGRIDVCGWHEKMLDIHDYIDNNYVDWDRIVFSDSFQNCRSQMLQGNYSGCMLCCPMNFQYSL